MQVPLTNVVRWMLAILFTHVAIIGCGPIEFTGFKPRLTGRCRDIPEAINTMRFYLPAQMPLKQRCKRYALLSSAYKERNLPLRLDVLKLSELGEDTLDRILEEIDVRDLMAFYMTAIDGYRSSQLAQPLFDLVECLRDIDFDEVGTYLDCPELILTLNLYRQVLESPETKINLRSIDLRQSKPAFVRTLRLLFKDNLLEDTSPENESASAAVSDPLARPSDSLQQQREEQKQGQVRILFEENISELSEQQRYERKRMQQRQRQRKSRLEKPQRHREQERLRKRRNRILQPSVSREKGRIWEQRRRDRIQERQKLERLNRRAQIRARIQQYEQLQTTKSQQGLPAFSPTTESMFTVFSTGSAQFQKSHRQPEHISETGELWRPLLSKGPPLIAPSLHGQQLLNRKQLNVTNKGSNRNVFDLPEFHSRSDTRQPLVRPMTSFPRPTQTMGFPSTTPSSFIDLHPAIRHDGETQHKQTSDLVQSRVHQNEDRIQPYNYLSDSQINDESLLSLLATFDADFQSSQFDDVDAVVQSFSDISRTIGESSSKNISATSQSRPIYDSKGKNKRRRYH